MTMSGALARPLLAGIFIYGGIDAFRDPEGKAKAADDVAPMIAEILHLPTTDTVMLVRINGGIQVVAGTLLAMGKWRRLSALALAGSLVPTTYAGHRFWEEVDEERRSHQRIQFLKNAAMLGGLVLAAGDTGGRPSVPWVARRATKKAVEATVAAGAATQQAAVHLLGSGDEAKDAAAATAVAAATAATGMARHLADTARQTDFHGLSKDLKKGLDMRAAKAAKKAQKAGLTRRALKAARKAQRKTEKAGLTRRARRIAKAARKRAHQLATQADLGERASRALQLASDTAGRAKDSIADDAVDRVREQATILAHHGAGRVRDALPVGS